MNEEEEQWYFVIEDVVAALTDCADPKQYIKRMKLCNAELLKGGYKLYLPCRADFRRKAEKLPNVEGK
ncbi:MAG: hypothetical protein IJR03_03630 [Bacteroidales bacterium]|nr:hypothetical protein [Bacteroidales bacterium]